MPVAPSIFFEAQHDPADGYTVLKAPKYMTALRPDELNLRFRGLLKLVASAD